METLASVSPRERAAWLAAQEDWTLRDILRREWWWIARPEQHAPPGRWFVWLILTGRGWGKTQTGSEWIVDRVLRYPLDTQGRPTEHLLVGETLSDAMAQCIGGPAGIRRVLERRLGEESRFTDGRDGRGWHLIKSPKPYIVIFEHGQMIHIQGADDEDVGRGYNLVSAWLDEYAKWKKPDGSWREGLMPALRIDIPGDHPRALVTTTPKPVVQLIEWQRRTDGSVHLTTGSTYENAGNLAALVLAELHRRYHGTRLGKQELLGELLMEAEGALWTLDFIEPYRVPGPIYTEVPELLNVVIGMDPPGGDEPTSDECGLVAAGRGVDGRTYVLGDWSKRIVGAAAARRAWEMYRSYGASLILIEENQGKAWLRQIMVDVYRAMQEEGLFPPSGGVPVKMIHAKVGKRLRADPIAADYERGQVSHVSGQNLADLETQMLGWVPEETKKSPDRIDAAVYAQLYLDSRNPATGELVSPLGKTLPRTTLGPLAGDLRSGLGPYG